MQEVPTGALPEVAVHGWQDRQESEVRAFQCQEEACQKEVQQEDRQGTYSERSKEETEKVVEQETVGKEKVHMICTC